MPSFSDFPLQAATQAAIAHMEITEPTPIQLEAIPALLAGRDLMGQSATGSGKTLAYGIPLVERLARNQRATQALVLVPTRELAIQVYAVINKLASSRQLSMALLVGGRPYGGQMGALRFGAQIVVGTPGRIQDHLERGTLVLNQLRMCVLDEADQMLDSGFAPAIEEILTTTPDTRQMAFFSATMPEWIVKLQQKFLKNPVTITIAAATGAQSSIEQIAYQVPQDQKIAALCTLLRSTQGESSLVFGRTKFGVEKLGKQLTKLGFTVGTLHGNKSQRAREEVLTAFRQGHVQTLLATNVAARGLDIQGIHQVINYELPESSDLFTHRVGRTGRMGRQGKAITLLAPSEVSKWRRMAHTLGQVVALQRLTIDKDADVTIQLAAPTPVVQPEPEYRTERQGQDERGAGRERRRDSKGQERVRYARPEHDSYGAPGMQRRQQVRTSRDARTWESEDFIAPERPYASRTEERRTERPFSSDRPAGKARASAVVTPAPTAPQQRPARPRPTAAPAPVARTRRPAATKRAASR